MKVVGRGVDAQIICYTKREMSISEDSKLIIKYFRGIFHDAFLLSFLVDNKLAAVICVLKTIFFET